MGQRLKRWESPRQTGRNDKGRGGSARQRQLQKRQQTWRQRLRETAKDSSSQGQTHQTKREGVNPPVFAFVDVNGCKAVEGKLEPIPGNGLTKQPHLRLPGQNHSFPS
jgi:hypothetical protein